MTRLSDVNEGINHALESGDGRFDSVDVHGATLRAGDVSSNLTPAASVAGWSNGKTPAVIEVVGMATGNAPVKDSPLVGSNSGVSTSARVDAPEASNSLAVFLGGIDALIQQVEGVLLRHRVTETGLAEVGQ